MISNYAHPTTLLAAELARSGWAPVWALRRWLDGRRPGSYDRAVTELADVIRTEVRDTAGSQGPCLVWLGKRTEAKLPNTGGTKTSATVPGKQVPRVNGQGWHQFHKRPTGLRK